MLEELGKQGREILCLSSLNLKLMSDSNTSSSDKEPDVRSDNTASTVLMVSVPMSVTHGCTSACHFNLRLRLALPCSVRFHHFYSTISVVVVVPTNTHSNLLVPPLKSHTTYLGSMWGPGGANT